MRFNNLSFACVYHIYFKIFTYNIMIAGIFTPIVRAVKIFVAADRYKTIRGSTISAHTMIINKFCEKLHLSTKTRQNLIRTARNNGKKLGLLD